MFETLKGRIPKSIDEDEYRKFAVMVALLKQEDGLHVVFEKRAGGLKRQPGEICLPGGARDGNESSEDNAIRETMEELEISREQIHMITQMDTLYTAYDNKVSVYLCELRDYDMTYNADEVAEIFTVPLKFFMETEPAAYVILLDCCLRITFRMSRYREAGIITGGMDIRKSIFIIIKIGLSGG